MMQPLFNDDARWNVYEEILLSWVGTPYRHKQCTKGRGTDCSLFIGASLKEARLLNKVDVPKYYPKDWFDNPQCGNLLERNLSRNLFNNCVDGVGYAKYNEKEVTSHVRGDICIFRIRSGSDTASHGCVLIDDSRMIHVSQRSSVRIAEYGNLWRSMLAFTYRLMEI